MFIHLISEEAPALILRIFVAGLLGALVGLERDIHGRAAGLRTNLLVSMGAALFTVLSEAFADAGPRDGAPHATSDPGRVAAQIVTGIGFLGAGAILKDGLTVRGLTTAACLWVVAAIGMAAGAGQYALAAATTALALFALVVLKYAERIYAKDIYRTLTIVTTTDADASRLMDAITQNSIHLLFVNFERDYEKGTMTIRLALRLFQRGLKRDHVWDLMKALEATGLPLKAVKWER